MKQLLSLIKQKIINLLERNTPTVLIEDLEPDIINDNTMAPEDLELLKEVLSVPTKYREEDHMIMYLFNYLEEKGYDTYIDGVGNVYAQKGHAEYMPCVVAHIDTVHNVDLTMRVEQNDNILFAVDETGKKIGIGGDDKNGVYIALRLLEEFDNIKVAFFISEEIGCIGSRASDDEFFANVGYTIQFDAPDDYMVTYFCDGTQLFDKDGKFYKIAEPIILKYFGESMQLFRHPYTDVSILKRKHDFSCINLSCGYYNMHTSDEYVKIDIIERSVNLGRELITALGEKLYFFQRQRGR